MSRLENKTVIVTGASSGIGRALSLELAGRGARLVLNARSRDALAECAAACGERGAEVRFSAGSTADEEVAAALTRQALELGSLAGFVHAAGVLHPGPLLWELDESRFREVFEAGPVAAWRLCRHLVPHLLEADEAFAVFFGSGAAEITQPGIAAYCSAKAALEHLARQLAAEAPRITTFVYRPGIVDTAMQTRARESEGGGAEALHEVFRPWKEQGVLLSPEESALGLVRILEGDPRRHHGRVAQAG